jgi:dihydrofolate reductase
MGKVSFHISMSLDGFITGPNVGIGNGIGDDGDRLHDWMFDAKTETDAAILDEIYESTGAVLIGKKMFDVGFEPWGDLPPVRDAGDRRDSRHAAAGDENVGIWGGANIIREYLRAGLLDEMQSDPLLLAADCADIVTVVAWGDVVERRYQYTSEGRISTAPP